MQAWWQFLRRLWPGSKTGPQLPSHLGGQGIPKILGICENCGAVVIDGLHRATVTGFICQRCASGRK